MMYLPFIILFSFCILTNKIYASDSENVTQLKQKIEFCTDANEKLMLINELLNTDFKAGSHPYWFEQQIKISESISDYKTKIRASANLARVYFNIEKKDSLSYWVNKVAQESKEHNWYDFYYDTQVFECMWHVRNRNFSVATQKVLRLKEEADSANSTIGKVSCEQILGLINYQTRNGEKAITHFETGIKLLDELPSRNALKCQFFIYLLMVNDDRTDYSKQEAVLDRFSEFISQESKKEKPSFAIGKAIWSDMYYRFTFHTKYFNKDSAAYYMQKTESLNLASGYNIRIFNMAKSRFYTECKDYERAIECIDLIINDEGEDKEDFIKYKADILLKMGKFKEANLLYNTAYEELNNNRKKLLMSEFDIIKEKNDLYILQSEARNIIYKTQKIKNQSTFIALILLFSLFIIVTIMLIYDQKYKVRQLKSSKELENEKQKLEKTKDALEIMLAKANESNRKKDIFLSTMSHELRTPLNSIVGFSELIANDAKIDSEVHSYTEIIRNNSAFLLKLINEIVDISKVESENIIIELNQEDIIKCCRECVESIKQIINKNVKATFTTETDILIINTDILRIRQILINLLGNAAKFTTKGEINLSVHMKDNKLSFCVTDTGCGIPDDKVDKIFDRFEKLNEVSGGTGLGLSICKTIAKKLNGHLYIDKKYKTGARFIFELNL